MNKNLALAETKQETAQAAMLERVIVKGDLSALSSADKTMYYRQVCESLGLNPLTSPFGYLKLSGREVLYAKKDATDQLRRVHGISVEIASQEAIDDLYIVVAKATDKTGRADEDTGVVSIKGLQGEAKANAIMKAITKAKRRATLSICGLGWLDETEADSIPNATACAVDAAVLDEIRAGLKALGVTTLAEAKARIGRLLNTEPLAPEDLTEDEAAALIIELAQEMKKS